MVSDKFRSQLRQEAALWEAEGLIDASQYEQLSERYQFNRLETVARNRFITILVGLGSVLIGLGIITFVAANWQALPRAGKVTLLLSLFIGVNVAGFYLWRRPHEAQQRLGHALLLLGALILGANMGLMGQMFHITGAFYELCLAWGVGVLAMAYSLRLTSLGVLSILLIGLGYVIGWWQVSEQFSWVNLLIQHMPLVAGLVFVPLAYWCRSRAIFVMAAIALIYALEFSLISLGGLFYGSPAMRLNIAIAFSLPPALLWSYDDALWVYGDFPQLSKRQNTPQASAPTSSFRPLARTLAVLFLGVLFYTLSFYGFWTAFDTSPERSELSFSPLLVDVLIFIGLAIFQWLRLAWQVSNRRTHRHEILTNFVIAAFIGLAALFPLWHLQINPIPELATLTFNALLFLLAAGLMREGLAQGERRNFWFGMVLLTLRIMTWFLLSATGLIFKSLMFILCGVGVMAVGLWFERYIRTLNNSPTALKTKH